MAVRRHREKWQISGLLGTPGDPFTVVAYPGLRSSFFQPGVNPGISVINADLRRYTECFLVVLDDIGNSVSTKRARAGQDMNGFQYRGFAGGIFPKNDVATRATRQVYFCQVSYRINGKLRKPHTRTGL